MTLSLLAATGLLLTAPGQAAGEHARLMVIEEDRSLRTLLVEVLASEDYDVQCAWPPERACLLAESLAPDAIVMDAGLPTSSARRALWHLHRSARTRHIPVVVLSGLAEPTSQPAGWSDYPVVAKPFDVNVLLEHVARAVQQPDRSSS
jgi:CheY-like chemotaxis protein